MSYSGEIPVVYENGVFRPETPLDIPEHSRLRISIREDGPGPANGTSPAALLAPNGQSRDQAMKELFECLEKSRFRSDGPYPTRDELHER